MTERATRDEVLETIRLVTIMGTDSCKLAIPVLVEEYEKFEQTGAAKAG